MSDKIIDLDVLLPEEQPPIKFTGKTDKKEYIVDLWIPTAVGLLIAENIELLMSIFPSKTRKTKFSKEAVDLILEVFAIMCREKYPHVNKTWIEKNISLPKLVAIGFSLAKPIRQFVMSAGFQEMVQPEKEPQAE